MQRIYALIESVGKVDTTVLITGESGTGKELVAEALHAESPRHNRTLVKVDCTAIPEDLLESELFGHKKGSFTGADRDRLGRILQADGGTLFLDEVGELPLNMQVKLLRVLQEHQVRPVGSTEAKQIDVRVISATHRDLQELMGEGKFREDLYYRLNVVNIKIPTLDERREVRDALAQAGVAEPDAAKIQEVTEEAVLRIEQAAQALRAELDASGVHLLGYLGDRSYFASLTESVNPLLAATVDGLIGVEAVAPACRALTGLRLAPEAHACISPKQRVVIVNIYDLLRIQRI